MSILIVEDNAVNALLLEHFLKKGGYRTLVANNAIVARQLSPAHMTFSSSWSFPDFVDTFRA
jgi:CheY-like chemotaxis protein